VLINLYFRKSVLTYWQPKQPDAFSKNHFLNNLISKIIFFTILSIFIKTQFPCPEFKLIKNYPLTGKKGKLLSLRKG